jgi:transposase, IS6 family
MGYSWRVDETYIKVKGEWTYLYRALDKKAIRLISISPLLAIPKLPNVSYAKPLSMKPWAYPSAINTDKAPAYRSGLPFPN